MRQSLVRVERRNKAVIRRGRPLVIRTNDRRVAQDQVRDHAAKDDAAVVVEVRPVVGGEVVHLGRRLADGVDELQRRLIQVNVRRRRRLGRRDGRQPLVVQRVGRVVRGSEDAPCEGRREELGRRSVLFCGDGDIIVIRWVGCVTYWSSAGCLDFLGEVLKVGLELAQ